MNYSNWTDFAINAAVGAATGLAKSSEPAFNLVIRNSNGKKFDPCNSWADAGPIIKDNRISLRAPTTHDDCQEVWLANLTEHDLFYSIDENPLRAAMIAFLMIQESK